MLRLHTDFNLDTQDCEVVHESRPNSTDLLVFYTRP